jgi:hypothetical protein
MLLEPANYGSPNFQDASTSGQPVLVSRLCKFLADIYYSAPGPTHPIRSVKSLETVCSSQPASRIFTAPSHHVGPGA